MGTRFFVAKSSRQLWTQFIQDGGHVTKKSSASPNRQYNPFQGRILGIDPSLRGTGWAIIDVHDRDHIDFVASQTLKLSARDSLLSCTGKIHACIASTIERYRPDVCAAEQTIYVQNFQTAQRMGIARGAILSAIAIAGLPIYEYAPLRIKQAICGYGRASKEQIARMVQSILRIQVNVGFDETDATAAALCCYFTERELKSHS